MWLYPLWLTDQNSSGGSMKLYSLSILYKGPNKANLLKAAYDLSSFSFFQRSRCVCLIISNMSVRQNIFTISLAFLVALQEIWSWTLIIGSRLPNSTSLCVFLGWRCFVFCSVQEFMTFTSALIVERTTQGSRASVKEQGKKELVHAC